MTSQPTKIVKLLSLLILLFITYLIGLNSFPKINTANTTNQNSESKITCYHRYISPNDPSKALIVDGELDGVYLSKNNSDLKFVTNIVAARNITWSQNSSKVSVSSHISNEEEVFIIDVETGRYVVAEGEQQFINSQDNPELFTHVYAGSVEWDKQNNLIIRVTGYPDGDESFRPEKKYLINSNTGKMMKEI